MNSSRKIVRALIPFYIAVEACILILIKIPVRFLSANTSNAMMFSSIALNAVFASFCGFAYRAYRKRSETDLIVAALRITVLGDLFLTLLGEGYLIPGVMCFCAVETVYAIYLRSPRYSIALRAALFLVLLVSAVLTKNVSVLNVASLVNISILAGNVFDAWRAMNKAPGLLFQIGITLFFCCDLSLGLSVLLSGRASDVMGYLIWMFYIPSQVFITLSYLNRIGKQ